MIFGTTVGVALVCFATASTATPRRAKIRDVRDFVLSVCFINQRSSADLRSQGFALGSIVMERTDGAIAGWTSLEAQVKRELARQPALTIHGDGPVGVETSAPAAQCLDMLEVPAVRAAMRRLTG